MRTRITGPPVVLRTIMGEFFFDDCQRKFLDEMIRVALLVKILIHCQNSTKSANKYCESCHKYWGKMQKILKSVRAKTEYTEKDV